VAVLSDRLHHLFLHRPYQQLRHLVLLEREHLYLLVLEHRVHHGLEELEHLVRLYRVELVRQVGLQVRHDLEVPQEVQKVVLCQVDQQERLFQEDQQVDQWEHLCQGDHLEDRVQGDLLVHRDH
jgi:hypothetical protein